MTALLSFDGKPAADAAIGLVPIRKMDASAPLSLRFPKVLCQAVKIRMQKSE